MPRPRTYSPLPRAGRAPSASEHGRTLERRPQPLEVARPDHWTSSRGSRCRVRSGSGARRFASQKLDDDGEAHTRPLRNVTSSRILPPPQESVCAFSCAVACVEPSGGHRGKLQGNAQRRMCREENSAAKRPRQDFAHGIRASDLVRARPHSRHDIVIGAGTAGCSRLASHREPGPLRPPDRGRPALEEARDQDPRRLLEALPNDARLGRLHRSAGGARRAGGRVSQGSGARRNAAINAMMVLRGHPSDYAWEADGCPGWSWATAEPAFRRSADGPFPLAEQRDPNVLTEAFVHAAQACGIPASDDLNGADNGGVRLVPVRSGAGGGSASPTATCAPPAAESDRRHGGSRHSRRRRGRAGSRSGLSPPRRDGRRRGSARRARGDPLRGSTELHTSSSRASDCGNRSSERASRSSSS